MWFSLSTFHKLCIVWSCSVQYLRFLAAVTNFRLLRGGGRRPRTWVASRRWPIPPSFSRYELLNDTSFHSQYPYTDLKVYTYLTGNTLRLCYESNRLMLPIDLWRWYINITITILDTQSQSQSYFTTDGQSVSMSWCRAQLGTFDQRYFFYPSSCLLFKTQLNSIGLSVPHRKHITSQLRAQQVNAIYSFVTMVY
jgi:hypothetical protein